MPSEGTEFDKKSLKSLTRPHPDWAALAGDCVAFANARGEPLVELTRLLELKSAEERQPWLWRLVEWRIVKTTGRTSGTKYFVDAELLRKLDFQGKTTLKAIEPYRLRELVLSDLRRHRDASISEIHRRIGTEIPLRDLRRELYRLGESGEIGIIGTKRWARYSIDQERSNPATLVNRNRPPQPRSPKLR